jgi:hypothetical protein
MDGGDRSYVVELPDDLIKQAAENLGIQDISRIPKSLVISAVSQDLESQLGKTGAGPASMIVVA